MKTKHLFFAAALMGSFASCTNENIISDDMQNAAGTRPVVGNVKLNFSANDAQTRVIYNKGYQWEASDEIGALLMDNVNDLSKPWGDRYTLTEYIHTAFPFTYDKNAKTWGCESKMLEGNYFFAWPWEDYDGNRKVIHSLKAQKQTGVSPDIRQESYADNQFFVGYSQIKAANTNGDILGTVDMTPILGALQFQITNVGTKTYHINKIVLSSGATDKIWSEMTINPTNAAYDTDTKFNYAKYVGEAVTGADYTKNGALRALVTNIGFENSAELTIDGSLEERALKSDNGKSVAYALIMCNPIETVSTGDLMLSIYTEEGMVSNIDLSERYTGGAGKYGIVTSSVVKSVGPDVVNTIGIQVDDNSFTVPTGMDIYNASDLYQFIYWNDNIAGTREITANLKKNLTLDSKTIALLEGSDNVTLKIKGNDNKITLAKDVDANFLDSKAWNITGTSGAEKLNIEVTNALTLTKDSKAVTSITVAGDDAATEEDETAVLTIDAADAVVPATIENYGKVTMGANAVVKNTTTITNYKDGVVELAANGESRAKITNNFGATVKNNAYMLNVTNYGGLEMGAGALLKTSTNKNGGKITTVSTSKVSVKNEAGAEIVYVDGADVTGTENEGTISFAYAGDIDDETFADHKINKVIINGKSTVIESLSIDKIEISGAELEVKENKTLTVNSLLTISGAVTTSGKGSILVGTEVLVDNEETNDPDDKMYKATGALQVKDGATWTNGVSVKVYGELDNDGTVYNNGTVKATYKNEGVWKHEAIVTNPLSTWSKDTSATDAQKIAYFKALDAFVLYYMNNASNYKSNVNEGKYSEAVKYATVRTSYRYWKNLPVAEELFAAAKAEDSNGRKINVMNTATGETDIPFIADSLAASINRIQTAKLAELKEYLDGNNFMLAQCNGTYFGNDGTDVEEEDRMTGLEKVVKLFKDEVISKSANVSSTNILQSWTNGPTDYGVASAGHLLTSEEVKAYLHADASVVYKGCAVETVLEIWVNYPVSGLGTYGSTKTGDNLANWCVEILNKNTGLTPAVDAAQKALKAANITAAPQLDQYRKYTKEQLKLIYDNNNQFK